MVAQNGRTKQTQSWPRRYRHRITSSTADRRLEIFYLSISSCWALPEVTRSEGSQARAREKRVLLLKGIIGEGEDWEENSSQAVRMAKLVHQSLAALRLFHNALLVVLPDTATELVIVHGGPVLPLAPEPRHPHRVLDLEDPLAAV